MHIKFIILWYATDYPGVRAGVGGWGDGPCQICITVGHYLGDQQYSVLQTFHQFAYTDKITERHRHPHFLNISRLAEGGCSSWTFQSGILLLIKVYIVPIHINTISVDILNSMMNENKQMSLQKVYIFSVPK